MQVETHETERKDSERKDSVKKRRKNFTQFNIYIQRILTDNNPSHSLSKGGLIQCNAICKVVLNKIIDSTNKILSFSKKATLTTSLISTAVQVYIPGELSMRCIQEGNSAIAKYVTTFLVDDENTGKKSRHERSGLILSISRVEKYIKKRSLAKRLGKGTPVFLAAVLQCIMSELLFLCIEKAREQKRARIKPRHIKFAILEDLEFKKMFSKTVLGGGV
jgi:histone H2A